MAHSSVCVHIHVVFGTKRRVPSLRDVWRQELHGFVIGIIVNHGCQVICLNSVEDHMHILFKQGSQSRIADVVRNVKSSSTQWIRLCDATLPDFCWQTGYWAGAVSRSHVERVRRYILNQAEHHRHRNFMDEYGALLRESGMDTDPRYIPD